MSFLTPGSANNADVDFMSLGGGKSVEGSGNLSSLFGLNAQMNNNPNSNQSLTYTAPKPPGKATASNAKQQASGGNASGVAIAAAVTAYKCVNNQNVKHGKLGAAILKNVAAKDYKIIMYVTKQQPVSTTQISPTFSFTVLDNNYACFCDDQSQTWTILFDTAKQFLNFAKQICLAKFFTSPQPPDSSAVVDLMLGDKQSPLAETGDSFEMKYTGWLVAQDGTLGSVCDSNHNNEKTFRFKAGRGKVIKGWDVGLLGMKKGGKRFLVIPPHLAYGQKSVGSKIPPNSTLAFEVDLLRLKQGKDNSSTKSGGSVESLPQAVSSDTSPPPNVALPQVDVSTNSVNNLAVEEPVKGRTASLTDQISHQLSGDSSKKPLLSRMARMGHAMLPTASNDEVLDPNVVDAVEQTHNDRASTPVQPQPAPEPSVPQMHSAASSISYSAIQQSSQPALQQPMQYTQPLQHQQQFQPSPTHHQHLQMHQPPQTVMTQQLMQQRPPISQNYVNQSMLGQQPPPSADPSSLYSYGGYRQMAQYPGYGSELMPILVSESRQQNSELRLLQEKVDKVSGLIEEVKKNTSDPTRGETKATSEPAMDAGAIMRNIQRIMEENVQLKKTVSEKNKQIETQNEKISDLLQQNQKHVEKSNLMLEQRNDSFKESFNQSQARSLQLEQDKVDLTQRLSDATSRVSELTLEVSNAKQKENDLKQKFKDIYLKEKERADEAEERVGELEEEVKSAGEKEKSLLLSDESMKQQLIKLNEQVAALNDASDEQNRNFREKLQQQAKEKEEMKHKLRDNEANYEAQMEKIKSNALQMNSENEQQNVQVAALRSELVAMETKMEETIKENEKKVAILQQKIGQIRSAYEEQSDKLEETTSQMEEADAYKDGYERLRSQASNMKEKYEARIIELQETLKKRMEDDERKFDSSSVVDEVKKIMNKMFQRVRTEISADEDYSGSQVLKIILQIIKSTTLSLLSGGAEDKEEKGESDDEDEESDDEEVESENEESNDEEEESINEEQKVEKEEESINEEEKENLVNNTQTTEVAEASSQPHKAKVEEHISEEDRSLQDESLSKDGDENTTDDTSAQERKTSEVNSEDISSESTLRNAGAEEIIDKKSDVSSPDATGIEKQEDRQEDKSEEHKEDANINKSSSTADSVDESVAVEQSPPDDGAAADLLDDATTVCDQPPADCAEKPPNDALNVNQPEKAVEEAGDVIIENNVSSADQKPSDAKLEQTEKGRTSSCSSSFTDGREPPPLFDDDSEDEDLDWLK